jgi:hypothetical protein
MIGHYCASLRGTSLTAQVWVYSGQTLTKPSGHPDLQVGHTSGCSREGAVEYPGIVVHLDCFVKCSELVYEGPGQHQ